MSARVQSTVYPLEYNKNNPLEGYNEWAAYIHSEVVKMEYTGQPVLRHYDQLLADDVRTMHRLGKEANEIINS